MEISAVSCILGIINTLAAYSRGVLHVECVMESVYASCIQLHPSPALSRAFFFFFFPLTQSDCRKQRNQMGVQ